MLVKGYLLVRRPYHYNIILSNTVNLVIKEMIQQSSNTIFSGHQIDVNDVTMLHREKNLLEHGAKETVWVRKNSSLNSNSYTRILPSHSWDHSINTLCSFSQFLKNCGYKK